MFKIISNFVNTFKFLIIFIFENILMANSLLSMLSFLE